jgi:hypothetical protein
VGSSGGKRTRIATSKPSAITSTRRLVLSRCTFTAGFTTMNLAISAPNWKLSSPTGQLIQAARFGADLSDHLFGGFCLDQHGDAAVVEFAADLRHREAAGR